jgi:hypothetical protein
MAVLDATNRARVCAQLQRATGGLGAGIGPLSALTKADLRAAVDAADQWTDDNASSFNLALPQPARGQLTATQKTILLCYVAMRRAGLLRAEED